VQHLAQGLSGDGGAIVFMRAAERSTPRVPDGGLPLFSAHNPRERFLRRGVLFDDIARPAIFAATFFFSSLGRT
jgi:hypothetical protein